MSRNHYLQLVLYKTYATLKAEAARTYISFLWWIVEPVMYMLVFYLVFALLLHRFTEDFVAFLLIGLVVWRWFDSTVRQGSNSIVSNKSLMRQVYVPKILFPTVVILSNSIKFLIVFVLLIVFLNWYGLPMTSAYWSLPLLLMTQLLVISAGTLLLSSVVPFVPDLRIVVGNILLVMFFVSGVFFSTDRVPEEYQAYLSLNPMFTLIVSYREVLLNGSWPDLWGLSVIVLSSAVVLVCGVALLRRFDRVYPRTTL